MTKLSVNINKLATLRNARGGEQPHLVSWAQKIESFGAHGITVHPRPDERHIKKQDVFDLKKTVQTEFNIEGYPSKDFLDLIKEVQPEQCTLVPDPPEVLTSNAGWRIYENQGILKEVLQELSPICRVSVFVEPTTLKAEEAEMLKTWGAARAELYTEDYAKNPASIDKYIKTAKILTDHQIELNAGHDLNLKNLSFLLKNIPEIKEVSIGHALICEALEFGMENTLSSYLQILKESASTNIKPL